MTFFPDPYDLELLTALGWATPLTTRQLHRLVAPDTNETTTQRHLQRLCRNDLVERVRLYRRTRGTTRRVAWVWLPAPKLLSVLPEDARLPPAAPPIRRALLEHDLLRSEILVTVLAQARGLLSGVQVIPEVRLDRTQPQPKCDAIVLLRRNPHDVPAGIPWTNLVETSVGEAVRGWAVEVDRATEGLSVIRHKAVAYKAIAENPDFYGREWHGRMPIPLWLVPDRVRAAAILDVWATVWPGGRWLLMTEASLPRLVAVEYRAGETRQVTLLDGWAPGGGSVRTGQRQT